MIDFNDNRRRNYALLDKDKLGVLGDIATNIECLNDTLGYGVEPKLERIAAALEALAGIKPAADTPTDNDEPVAAWTIKDNDGATVCEGVTKNTGAFVFSALTEYAKHNAPELAFTYKDNGNG